MQSWKAQVHEESGHAAEEKQQIRNSITWINRPRSVLPSWLIYAVDHLLVKNNKREGRGGLKKKGDLISSLEKGSLLQD